MERGYYYIIQEEKDGSLTTQFAPSGAKSTAGKQVARTLADFAGVNGMTPYAVGTTNANGEAVFTNLPEGIYLACQGKTVLGYKGFLPFFLAVPMEDEQYEYVARPKIEEEDRPETTEISVEKAWKGEGKHPAKVMVQLWHDGDVYEAVELNDSNNWSYSWENLPASSDWEVREYPVPNGYTSSVDQDGIKFTVVNTKNEIPWPIPILAISGILLFSAGCI